MSIAAAAGRDLLAGAYATGVAKLALFSTAPTGGTAGTKLAGGSPAYADVTPTVSTPSQGVRKLDATFNVKAGDTVKGWGAYASDGTYLDGGTLTDQSFSAQGTLALSVSYTQS
jgi:hypothetical protein